MNKLYLILGVILIISCNKEPDPFIEQTGNPTSKLDSLIQETIISVESKSNSEAITYYTQFDYTQCLDSEIVARARQEDITKYVDRRLATVELGNYNSSDDFVILVEATGIKYLIAPDTSEIWLRDTEFSNEEIYRMKLESDVENFVLIEIQFGEAIVKVAYGEDYTEEEWENLGRALWRTYDVQETIEYRALANDVYNSTEAYPLKLYNFNIYEDEFEYWVISHRAYTALHNKLKSFIDTYKNYKP